jgi:hypothetical protein
MCLTCHSHDTVIAVILRAQAAQRPLSDHEVTLVVQRLRHDGQRKPSERQTVRVGKGA